MLPSIQCFSSSEKYNRDDDLLPQTIIAPKFLPNFFCESLGFKNKMANNELKNKKSVKEILKFEVFSRYG